MAAPSYAQTRYFTIEKTCAIIDKASPAQKIFIICENPQDVLRLVEGGVPIKTLNVGSMAHSTGKTMVNNVLSMDKDDVATYEKLRDLGVEFDVRKVPNDSKKDLFDLITKANVQ